MASLGHTLAGVYAIISHLLTSAHIRIIFLKAKQYSLVFVQQLVYILKEGEKTIESVNSQNILVKFISHSDF